MNQKFIFTISATRANSVNSLLHGGPLSTSVSDTVSSLSNVHSQLLSQMMGTWSKTELNGRHVKVIKESAFPSDVFETAPTNRSVAEKRKGAIPAVESGIFN